MTSFPPTTLPLQPLPAEFVVVPRASLTSYVVVSSDSIGIDAADWSQLVA